MQGQRCDLVVTLSRSHLPLSQPGLEEVTELPRGKATHTQAALCRLVTQDKPWPAREAAHIPREGGPSAPGLGGLGTGFPRISPTLGGCLGPQLSTEGAEESFLKDSHPRCMRHTHHCSPGLTLPLRGPLQQAHPLHGDMTPARLPGPTVG